MPYTKPATAMKVGNTSNSADTDNWAVDNANNSVGIEHTITGIMDNCKVAFYWSMPYTKNPQ